MASRDDYTPVDRRSFSADDGSRSLLSHDEKMHEFDRRRPAKRRMNFILKSFVSLLVLIAHAGLVAFLMNWFGIVLWGGSRGTVTGDGMTAQHGHGGHGDSSCQTDSTHVRYGFEGVIPAVYKDPNAEFSQINPCGHSAEEARARGCRYGMLYGAWLPEDCYDEETEENFKKYTNWRFWLQQNRTEEVSWDELAKGEHEYVLVEWEYHQRHCAEMNRRLFTAVSRRGLHTLDSYLSQWDHIDHCAHSAMEQRPLHEINAILWRKFPDCGLVRWKDGPKY